MPIYRLGFNKKYHSAEAVWQCRFAAFTDGMARTKAGPGSEWAGGRGRCKGQNGGIKAGPAAPGLREGLFWVPGLPPRALQLWGSDSPRSYSALVLVFCALAVQAPG
jgi:hypothetical protein